MKFHHHVYLPKALLGRFWHRSHKLALYLGVQRWLAFDVGYDLYVGLQRCLAFDVGLKR